MFEAKLCLLDLLWLSDTELTLTQLLFQHTSFFAFGGSNGISSIDLSNAYNGVSGYNAGAVGLLGFCGNWAGPLWWTSATTLLLCSQGGRNNRRSRVRHVSLLTVSTASSVFCVMLACTLLRTHLFIWTVFSPKYLYIMAWSIGQHVCANVIVGNLFY